MRISGSDVNIDGDATTGGDLNIIDGVVIGGNGSL